MEHAQGQCAIPVSAAEGDRCDLEAGKRDCLSLQEASACIKAGKDIQCKSVKVGDVCIASEVAMELMRAGDSSNDTSESEVVLESDWVKLLRALVAEAIGTGVIVMVGCGSVCSTFSGSFQGIWQVAIVWGIGVALAIYSTADISGGHLNPAMTLAFRLIRPQAHGMTWFKAFLYVVAHMAGAIIGGLLNLAIYADTLAAFERENNILRGEPRSVLTAAGFGEYFPNPAFSQEWGNKNSLYVHDDISVEKALFVEAIGACSLAFVIFGLTNKHNKVGLGPGAPFMIGATVAVNLAIYAPISQAGFNPARDFGPRLIAFFAGWGEVAIPGPKDGFWVYIVGPLIGAPVGAALADLLLWRRVPTAKKS